MEAIQKNYKSKEPMPKIVKCEFCGSALYSQGILHPLHRDTVFKWLSPERCSCEDAIEWWAKDDMEREKIKQEKEDTKEKEKMKKRIQQYLGNSGIKKRFMNRTFSKYEVTKKNREAFLTAKQYAEDFDKFAESGEGLYLEGSCGTGKTHLAAAISLHLINKGVPVICKTLIDLLGEIKKTFDGGEVKEHEILELYKNVDLLIVDDLGKEISTTWALSNFYAILNERYENCKPVIVTTNYNDSELVRKLSERGDLETAEAIVSRLRGMCFAVEMNWEDWRYQH